MKNIMKSVGAGLLVLVPLYLAVLLLLKGMKSIAGLIHPIAALLPESWPAETLLALLFILLVCFTIGAAVQTAVGHRVREAAEQALFERIPGYSLIRSLTHRVAGDADENAWKPVLVLKVVSRWGSGAKAMAAAIENPAKA